MDVTAVAQRRKWTLVHVNLIANERHSYKIWSSIDVTAIKYYDLTTKVKLMTLLINWFPSLNTNRDKLNTKSENDHTRSLSSVVMRVFGQMSPGQMGTRTNGLQTNEHRKNEAR